MPNCLYYYTGLHDYNIQMVKDTLGNSGDIIIREIRIGQDGRLKAAIFYTDGLADTGSIHDFIMETLMLNIQGTDLEQKMSSAANPLDLLKESILAVGDIQDVAPENQRPSSLAGKPKNRESH